MDGTEKVKGSPSRHHSFSRSRSRGLSMEDGFLSTTPTERNNRIDEDEEALTWAAIERLPTYNRLRTSIIKSFVETDAQGHNRVVHKEVDVQKLDVIDRQKFIDSTLKVAEKDNEKFLRKFRSRIDQVGIKLPTVQVRFEHLTVEVDCHIGTRALPTLPNAARNIAEAALGLVGIRMAKRTSLKILKDQALLNHQDKHNHLLDLPPT